MIYYISILYNLNVERKVYITLPLKKGKFIRMMRRFLCRVEVDGKEDIAHIPDPSPLKELFERGRTLFLEEKLGKERISNFTVYAVETSVGLIGINSLLSNRIIKNAISSGMVLGNRVKVVRSEVSFGGKRFDFLVETEHGESIVEVKSVSLIKGRTAFFPHSPTVRGREHVQVMVQALEQKRASLIFVAQCSVVEEIKVNMEVDPLFYAVLKDAVEKGVKVTGFKLLWEPPYIWIGGRIPVVI